MHIRQTYYLNKLLFYGNNCLTAQIFIHLLFTHVQSELMISKFSINRADIWRDVCPWIKGHSCPVRERNVRNFELSYSSHSK